MSFVREGNVLFFCSFPLKISEMHNIIYKAFSLMS